MTRAEVEPVDPDRRRAAELLAQARALLDDADRAAHLASSVILYWTACLNAMDAVLSAEGLRVGSGDEAHSIRVHEVARLLGGHGDLFERLDEWRRERHRVSYAAVTPSAADVASMQGDTRDFLAAVQRYLAGLR